MNERTKIMILRAIIAALFLCYGGHGAELIQNPKNAKSEAIWICQGNSSISASEIGKGRKISFQDAMKRVTYCEPPIMPELARTARLQATVVVEVIVGSDGKVRCYRTIRGHPLLNQSAIDAAVKWEFRPFGGNAKGQDVDTILVFIFSTSGVAPENSHACTKARWGSQ
jgi:TonB family protein